MANERINPLNISSGGVLDITHGGTGATSLDSITVGAAKGLAAVECEQDLTAIDETNCPTGLYDIYGAHVVDNAPSNEMHWRVLVLNCQRHTKYTVEIAFPYSVATASATPYIRKSDGNTFGKWYALYSEARKPTIADIAGLESRLAALETKLKQ